MRPGDIISLINSTSKFVPAMLLSDGGMRSSGSGKSVVRSMNFEFERNRGFTTDGALGSGRPSARKAKFPSQKQHGSQSVNQAGSHSRRRGRKIQKTRGTQRATRPQLVTASDETLEAIALAKEAALGMEPEMLDELGCEIQGMEYVP